MISVIGKLGCLGSKHMEKEILKDNKCWNSYNKKLIE